MQCAARGLLWLCAPAHVHVHPWGLTQWAIHNFFYISYFSYLTQWAIHNFSYISYFSYLTQWTIHNFSDISYFSYLTQWAIHNFSYFSYLTQWAIHNFSYNSHFSYLTQWAIHNFPYISYFSHLTQWAIHNLTQWAIPNLTQWGIHNFSYRSNAFLCKPSVLLKAPDFKQWRLRWQELSVQVCTCLKSYFHILILNLRSFSFAPSASERPLDVADDTTLFLGGLSIRD